MIKVLTTFNSIVLFIIILSVSMILGCSSDSSTDDVNLGSKVSSPSESVKESGEEKKVEESKAPEKQGSGDKTTVVDALGRSVEFASVPSRIATISPTATEILYAAGGTSILRDRASTVPEEVVKLPDVGSAYDPSIEAIIGARPDLVIIEALTQARFIPILEKAGLKVLAVKTETVDDLVGHLEDIGELLGKGDVSGAKIAEIRSRLDKAGSSDGRSTLVLISDQDRNLYAAKPDTYPGLIVATLGLVNEDGDVPDSGPYPGFAMMSVEQILGVNPDVLVTITPAPEPAPRLSDTIRQIPPFAALKVVRTGSIFEADPDLFLQSPGPRIVEAVEALREGLKP